MTDTDDERIRQLIAWILAHSREIGLIEKGQLIFNIAGTSIRPVLTIHYEPSGECESRS